MQSPPRRSQAVKFAVVSQGAAEAIDLLPRELSDAGAPRSRRAVLTTPTVLPDGYEQIALRSGGEGLFPVTRRASSPLSSPPAEGGEERE